MRPASPLKLEFVRRGLVQADIAQAAKMSETKLSRIINRRVEPSDQELEKLAMILGVSSDQLKV